MIQDMTVRLKLSLAFALLLFFLIIVAFVGWLVRYENQQRQFE